MADILVGESETVSAVVRASVTGSVWLDAGAVNLIFVGVTIAPHSAVPA